jgi:recombination protein RecA
MALPASLLAQFPEPAPRAEVPTLALGIAGLDEILPDGGLPGGAVVEVAISGGLALGTSLALAACRSAQGALGGEAPGGGWCAFVDPSATLHGPGVAGAGVRLDRLLVVQPPVDALERTALRLAESRIFSLLVIDTLGVPGASIRVALGAWPRIVRRLSLAVSKSGARVLLLTDGEAMRPLPLPVALRVEVRRSGAERLSVHVAKERRGRISSPRTVAWVRSGQKASRR